MNLSVIIPAHNMANTLERAALSALNAGCQDVVIVDDSSTDHTFPLVDSLRFRYRGRVRYYETGAAMPAGVCHARNLGITRAYHDLIVCLDADDCFLPSGLCDLFCAHQPNSFVYGGWLENDEERIAPPIGMINRKAVCYATWLFERQAWQRVGGFSPNFNIGGEDHAFMLALLEHDVQPVHILSPVYRRSVNVNARTEFARGHSRCIATLLREQSEYFQGQKAHYERYDKHNHARETHRNAP